MTRGAHGRPPRPSSTPTRECLCRGAWLVAPHGGARRRERELETLTVKPTSGENVSVRFVPARAPSPPGGRASSTLRVALEVEHRGRIRRVPEQRPHPGEDRGACTSLGLCFDVQRSTLAVAVGASARTPPPRSRARSLHVLLFDQRGRIMSFLSWLRAENTKRQPSSARPNETVGLTKADKALAGLRRGGRVQGAVLDRPHPGAGLDRCES